MGKLYRNRELLAYLAAFLLISAVSVLLCLRWSRAAALAAGIGFGVLLALSVAFSLFRYHRLAALAHRLARLAAGQEKTDFTSYTEGELSILGDELQKITRTLTWQARQLQADKDYLADSLSDISHQLKTPLTSISVLAELLENPALPEDKRLEFLRNINAGVERLRWLVSALLKLSRLDAGAVALAKDRLSLPGLVRQAAQPLLIPMELAGQRFTILGDEAFLTGDCQWLAEAIGNLLKNCAEHTPPGGSITARCTQTPLYTLLEISDTGPGIAPADLPHIFERFYRGKNAGTDSVGIGLALSKTIITRHGGVLEAACPPGGGARFTARFYQR